MRSTAGMEQTDHIFDMIFTMDAPHKRTGTGMGVGLSGEGGTDAGKQTRMQTGRALLFVSPAKAWSSQSPL